MWPRIVFAVLLGGSGLTACAGTDPCGEGPGPLNWLADAERWLIVDLSALNDIEIPDEDRTLNVDVEAAPVTDADHHGTFTTTTVTIHDSFVADIQGALDDGATVWLALSTVEVSYPLARLPDGTHRLLGDHCVDPANEFLQQRLGASFDERMEAIVGLTDRQQIAKLLRPPA